MCITHALFFLHQDFMVQRSEQRQQLVDTDRTRVKLHCRHAALTDAQALSELCLRQARGLSGRLDKWAELLGKGQYLLHQNLVHTIGAGCRQVAALPA